MVPRREAVIPNIIFMLLIVNGLMFAGQQYFGLSFTYSLSLWPFDHSNFRVWQLVTHGFLHHPSSVAHLAINMLILWMFGRDVEREMGEVRFAAYYVSCVVGAGLIQSAVAWLLDGNSVGLGASGGVFGVLLAFGFLFPNRIVVLLVPPIPMKAKNMVLLFGVVELFFGVTGLMPGVANFAHLGGMLVGLLLLLWWRPV